MIYFTLSSVTACFFPDLVHIGIIPSFTATTPTLMESADQNRTQMQLHTSYLKEPISNPAKSH